MEQSKIIDTLETYHFIIARGGRVNLDPDDVVARLEHILGRVDVPTK